MKLRAVVCLLVLLTFFGAAAKAQDSPKVDIFAGYSYFRVNPATSSVDSFNLHGGSASFAYNANHWFSGVADFGGYHGSDINGTGADATLSTYLFGPRISYRHYDRVTPFGQVLFGVAHAGASAFGTSGSDNAFATAVGGGFDVKVAQHLAIRPAQVDYLLTRFPEITSNGRTQNNLRVSTGVVFRF